MSNWKELFHKDVLIKKIERSKKTCIECAVVAGLLLATGVAVSSGNSSHQGAYTAVINNVAVGTVDNEQEAMALVAEVQADMARDSGNTVMAQADVQLIANGENGAEPADPARIKENISKVLGSSAATAKQLACTVRINDFSVTVPDKDAALQIFEAAREKYDANNLYSVTLTETTGMGSEGGTFSATLERNPIPSWNVAVSLSLAPEREAAYGTWGSVVGMEFADPIEIVENYVSPEEITDIDAAIELVIKDKEKNKIYQVGEGDCPSIVAEKNDMTLARLVELNGFADENQMLRVGDELIVAVPEPELSVIVKEEASYQEEYTAETVYIDNTEWYTTKEEVISEGAPGLRQVTAVADLRNGKEVARNITAEHILKESTPSVIERGTIVPPTYIKPLSGGIFTSGFGARWGTVHKGIDWACPTGTPVVASSGGTIARAEWSDSYGYVVYMSHPDGRQTRYAHLDKLLVEAGETVEQGETIALSGNTGDSTGPHVHFEILINGVQVDPLSNMD